MEQYRDYFEKIMKLLIQRFDAIDKKLDRHLRVKNILEDDELLDNQDVCQFLNISYRTLQRYKREEILPYTKVGGKSQYLKSDLNKLVNKK